MIFNNQKGSILVSCAARISPYLEKEINQLGFNDTENFKTGVRLKGNMNDCIRLNICLRTASQVYFSIKKFNAWNADELYSQVKSIAWENLIPANGYFSLNSNVKNETIDNPLFVNMRMKDAIADRFREQKGSRPNSGADSSKAVFYLYWQGNEAEIFLDTSGETLSKHGYRKIPGKAPMMESLAAATIIAGNWDTKSHFINPMCGSGTLAIEAAMMATGKVPGMFRENYSFMHILGYKPDLYEQILEEELEKEKENLNFKIIASDISEDAIKIAKINASIAGVDKYINFELCDFYDTTVPDGPGAVYFNPEYGDRLGTEQKLVEVYDKMGDFLKKKCSGYFGYIFTGNLELAKKIGLKPKRRIEFFNGKIDCRLLEYEMWAGKKASVANSYFPHNQRV